MNFKELKVRSLLTLRILLLCRHKCLLKMFKADQAKMTRLFRIVDYLVVVLVFFISKALRISVT